MNWIVASYFARLGRAVRIQSLMAAALSWLLLLAANGAILASMGQPAFQGLGTRADGSGGGGGGMFTTASLGTPGFDIVLLFNNTPTAGELAAFQQAEARWESIITGYRITDLAYTDVLIDVYLHPIDGPGTILGSAGPTAGKANAALTDFTPTYLYADAGEMEFDSADSANYVALGLFDEIVLHEMGHVLGIGTLWSASAAAGISGRQELYVANSGQYTGAAGIAAYNAEFSQTGSSVPVELGGGAGTANAHWDEATNGAALTGRVSNLEPGPFNDMRYELMTGWLNTQSVFISSLTKRSMIDMGYTVAPEPGVVALVGVVVCALVSTRSAPRRG